MSRRSPRVVSISVRWTRSGVTYGRSRRQSRYVGSECPAYPAPYPGLDSSKWDAGHHSIVLQVNCSLLLEHVVLSVIHTPRTDIRVRPLGLYKQCLTRPRQSTVVPLQRVIRQRPEPINGVRSLGPYVCALESCAVATVVYYALQVPVESLLHVTCRDSSL